jgi:hypothetical protein
LLISLKVEIPPASNSPLASNATSLIEPGWFIYTFLTQTCAAQSTSPGARFCFSNFAGVGAWSLHDVLVRVFAKDSPNEFALANIQTSSINVSVASALYIISILAVVGLFAGMLALGPLHDKISSKRGGASIRALLPLVAVAVVTFILVLAASVMLQLQTKKVTSSFKNETNKDYTGDASSGFMKFWALTWSSTVCLALLVGSLVCEVVLHRKSRLRSAKEGFELQ